MKPTSDLAPEGGRRSDLGGRWKAAVYAIGVAMAAFHLYTAATTVLPPMEQRSIHLAFALALVFLTVPFGARSPGDRPSWPSLALGGLAIASCAYIVWGWLDMSERTTEPTTADLVFGIAAVALVLEAARRTLGAPLPVIGLAFILYAFLGEHLPDPFGHPGMDLDRFLSVMYMTDQGLFGLPLGVSATYVFLFVVFAELLVALGGGHFFIEIAYALLGKFRGGPAKVAVVASALMGTVSGSAVANVAATGSITIPLMKSTGYTPSFAAAVEAVASTGGQIMPPIMSAAAFVMAEILGVPYASIVFAALLPAILYFFAVFVAVDLEAAKRGIRGLPREQLPSARAAFRKNGHVLVPLGVLIHLLVVMQYSPMMSVFWSIVAMVAVDALRQLIETRRLDWRRYVRAMERSAVTSVSVVAACAGAGVIIGVVAASGLGLTLSGTLVELAGGNMPVLLVLTMIASLILGMGLSTVASYIVLAVLAAPALAAGGIPPMAAHLFVLYFGVISVITPPVALAAYVAAGIAGADPMKVGWMASRLGVVAFLIPYYFVNNPALLLIGGPVEVLLAAATACVGIMSLVAALAGYSFAPCGIAVRAGYLLGALLLIDPDPITDLAGALVVAACLLAQWLRRRASAGAG